MTLRLPRAIDEPDPAALLALLWREALANPLHMPGCGCIGGGGLALHADMLEEDLLDFLAARHARNPEVTRLLDERRQRGPEDFSDWLQRALPRLDAPDRAAILDEVNGVLLSITGRERRGGF